MCSPLPTPEPFFATTTASKNSARWFPHPAHRSSQLEREPGCTSPRPAELWSLLTPLATSVASRASRCNHFPQCGPCQPQAVAFMRSWAALRPFRHAVSLRAGPLSKNLQFNLRAMVVAVCFSRRPAVEFGSGLPPEERTLSARAYQGPRSVHLPRAARWWRSRSTEVGPR